MVHALKRCVHCHLLQKVQGTPRLFKHMSAALDIPKCHPTTIRFSHFARQAMQSRFQLEQPNKPCTDSTKPWHCINGHPPMSTSIEYPMPTPDLCSVHCLQCLQVLLHAIDPTSKPTCTDVGHHPRSGIREEATCMCLRGIRHAIACLAHAMVSTPCS